MARKYTQEQEVETYNNICNTLASIDYPVTALMIKRAGNLADSVEVITRICKKYEISKVVFGKDASYINRHNAALEENERRKIKEEVKYPHDKIGTFQKLVTNSYSWQELMNALEITEKELEWLCKKCAVTRRDITTKNRRKLTEKYKIDKVIQFVEKNKYNTSFPLTLKQISKGTGVDILTVEKAVKDFDFIIRGERANQIDEIIRKKNYSKAAKRNSPQAQETIRKNNLKKYGVEWITQTEHFKEISRKSRQERYGDPNFNNREKAKETLTSKYCVDNVMKIPSVKQKAIKTSVERYGETNPSKSENVIRKISQTSQMRYGVSYPCLSANCINTNRVCYEYEGIKFDSKWELCYYLYELSRGKHITRYDGKGFSFFVDGEYHVYFPDFIVEEKLVEIKGPQFFNEEGTLINPFTNDEHLQLISAEKGKLMKKLGVAVISNVENEIRFVVNTFGEDFIESCRR